LNKGLGFCPTPNNTTQIDFHTDVLRFIRKIRLQHYHHINPKDETQSTLPRKFKPPSYWTPGQNINHNLDLFCNIFETEMLSRFQQRKKAANNITKEESQALKELSQNRSIIIKPADKGGAIVIQDIRDYQNEANRQLADRKVYSRLTKDITGDKQKDINKLLKSYLERNWLNEQEYKYLCTYQPRTSVFYLLPKIHKKTRPPPGRPIVSACGSITEKISAFVDEAIRPYVQKQSSFIRDTQDFLEKIKDIMVDEHTILATIDVTSLYTSIPHQEGIEAIREVLLENKHDNPPIECITQLTELVLKNNVFRFKDTYYLQIQGTAMGTKMAPSYANLFMAQLETKFLSNQPCVPSVWLRFIDDIFLIWDHPLPELQLFLQDLNTFHSTIKFTMEMSKDEIHFLDTTIYKSGNKLSSKLYVKPTDAHLYLRFDSCHPRNCINSIPYSQITRLKRIHTDPVEASQAMNTMIDHFAERRYPRPFLKRTKEKVLNNPVQIQNKPEDNLVFITGYYPTLTNLKEIWNRNINILKQHPDTAFLSEINFMVAYRRPRNIKDVLVKTDLQMIKIQQGSYPCRKLKCLTCKYMTQGTTFSSSKTRECYKIHGKFNCQSTYVIYLITCAECNIQYVGQTSTTLNSRMSSHRHDIRHQLDKPVSKHFSNDNSRHNIRNMQITVIDYGPHDVTSRHLRETSWIRQLVTMEPHGLNINQSTA
jgi:hypothetical protein